MIVAPPRSASTAFSRVFWEQGSVAYYCHEPFEVTYFDEAPLGEVVAKLEAPLSGIQGFDIVTMFADILISGHTISGDAVTASGRLQIDFANYGDSESSCPSS